MHLHQEVLLPMTHKVAMLMTDTDDATRRAVQDRMDAIGATRVRIAVVEMKPIQAAAA